MQSPTEPLATLGFVVFSLLLVIFFGHHLLKNWQRELNADFAAALKRLGIDSHEILVDRIVQPSRQNPGEVYRILHNHTGHYFLYLFTTGSPGVLQPLTKERALLAVKLNG